MFKKDILDLPPEIVLRKHVLFGECHSLESKKYYELRQEIADHFSIYPSEIVMVGSGRLGFSIVEKYKKPRFRLFGEDSDLDIAILSPKLFDLMWLKMHEAKSLGIEWTEEDSFKNYLLSGWIRPDKFPMPAGDFTVRKEWFEYFNKLTHSRKYGRAAINAGIYRNWRFLESYQLKSINSCKSAISQ